MDKMKLESADITAQNIEKIAELFPNCITETKDENGNLKKAINFDLLKQDLSKDIVDGKECYEFTWVGKKESIIEANRPIRKTLIPYKDESVNWDTTENLYIEGDNLEVLKLLQESYLGKVKMIYIDPPYNTGNDFIYNDTFKATKDDYENASGNVDEFGNKFKQNTDSNGRFHSDWCSMIYSRLCIARNLLNEEGVIFISIDDNEVDNLKKICNEVFGESNFVGCAGRITKKSNNKGDYWAPNFDYLLTYTKNIDLARGFTGGANEKSYNIIEDQGARKGERYQLVRLYMSSIKNRNPEQRFWIECPDGTHIIPPGSTFPPERPNLGDGIWRWSKSTFEANRDKIVIKKVRSSNLLNDKHEPAEWNVFTKTYLSDVLDNSTAKPNSFIEDHINQNSSHELNALNIPFDYAKPTSLIKYLMKVCKIQGDDIVMDFFSGSASSADAVMQYSSEINSNKNIKFIMVQLPEPCDEKSEAFKAGYKNICEIGKERIRRAAKKIAEENPNAKFDGGFRVFKVADSNMKDVYYAPADYNQSLLDKLESNIKEDRTDLDLFFGCILDWGLPLNLSYTSETIENCSVHTYSDNALIACFNDNIPESVIKEIAKRKPLRVVFRDSSFADTPSKINVTEIFKLLSPDTRVKVI